MTADNDSSIMNASEITNRLMNDICSESSKFCPLDISWNNSNLENQDKHAFTMPRFIKLLVERMSSLNPHTRIFIINWISVLSTVPDLGILWLFFINNVELISYLPAFLKNLFNYMNDPNSNGKKTSKLYYFSSNVNGKIIKRIIIGFKSCF